MPEDVIWGMEVAICEITSGPNLRHFFYPAPVTVAGGIPEIPGLDHIAHI